jgi:hypothetical protein
VFDQKREGRRIADEKWINLQSFGDQISNEKSIDRREPPPLQKAKQMTVSYSKSLVLCSTTPTPMNNGNSL